MSDHIIINVMIKQTQRKDRVLQLGCYVQNKMKTIKYMNTFIFIIIPSQKDNYKLY